jgi:hypothetical protein
MGDDGQRPRLIDRANRLGLAGVGVASAQAGEQEQGLIDGNGNKAFRHPPREDLLDAANLAVRMLSAPARRMIARLGVGPGVSHGLSERFKVTAVELGRGNVAVHPAQGPDDVPEVVELFRRLALGRAVGVHHLVPVLVGDRPRVIAFCVGPESFQKNRDRGADTRGVCCCRCVLGQFPARRIPFADGAVVGSSALRAAVDAKVNHLAVYGDVRAAGWLVKTVRWGGFWAGHVGSEWFFCTVQKNSRVLGRTSRHGKVCLTEHPA